MKSLPFKIKIYLSILFLLTPISLFLFSNSSVIPGGFASPQNIIIFIFLSAITESLSIVFKTMVFSFSFAIIFASFILFGPYTTILVLILGFSFRVFKVQEKRYHILNTPIYKTLFNISILILTFICASYVHYLTLLLFNNKVISYILFCLIYFFINIIFISILNSLLLNSRLINTIVNNIKPAIMSILIVVPFGATIAYVYYRVIWGIPFFLFPILLARYTFILYMDTKSRYVQTVDVLMRSMEARDKYTEGHSHRVAEIVNLLAKEFKFSDAKIERLNIASLLHDVGKIGIDDNILNKPGKLTNEEYEAIKEHPMIGYNILKNIKDFKDISLIVKYHHERYDGKGYPEGKSYRDLSIDTFIVQLADTVDAMLTNRPYRDALTLEDIKIELIKNRGTQFHPEVVDAYLRILEK